MGIAQAESLEAGLELRLDTQRKARLDGPLEFLWSSVVLGRSWSFGVLGCRVGGFYFNLREVVCSSQVLALGVLKFVVGFEGFRGCEFGVRAMVGLSMCEG